MEKKRWRIIHVNANLPAASFYTYEIEGKTIADYDTSLQDYLTTLAGYKDFTMGVIGDAYSEWSSDDIPELLTKANTK